MGTPGTKFVLVEENKGGQYYQGLNIVRLKASIQQLGTLNPCLFDTVGRLVYQL